MNTILNHNGCFYQDVGNRTGIPVLFIHAFPLSHRMWDAQVEALRKTYRTISYDIRGFGQSGVGDGQYTIDLLVEDIAALQKHLGISSSVICGLSMGGYLALRMKELYPDRVKALVLADTRTEPDGDEGKIKRGKTLQAIKTGGVSAFAEGFMKGAFAPSTYEEKPEIIAKTRGWIHGGLPLGICGALLAMACRTDTQKALSQAPVPTLLLVGEHDTLTPPAASQAMQALCPGSKLSILKKAGHLSNLENPEDFNQELLQFLRSLPS